MQTRSNPLSVKNFYLWLVLLTLIYGILLNSPLRLPGAYFYGNDDQAYYSYLPLIFIHHHLHFEKLEYFPKNILKQDKNNLGHYFNPHPIGPSLIWGPIFWIGQKACVFFKHIFNDIKVDGYSSLILSSLCLLILFQFLISGCLIYKTLQSYFDQECSSLATLLILFGTFLPIYFFRHPLLSHSQELFLFAVSFYSLDRFMRTSSSFHAWILGLSLGLLLLTRWNHVLLLFIPFLVWWLKKERPSAYIIFGFLLILIIGMLYLNITWNMDIFLHKADKALHVKKHMAPLSRIFHILCGQDWGMLWTAFPVCIGVLGLALKKQAKPFYPLYGMMLCIVPTALFITFKWKTQAGFYGYRYLIPLWIPAVFGLATLLEKIKNHVSKFIWEYGITGLCFFLILFQFLCLIQFESSSELGLHLNSKNDWTNTSYVFNAINNIWRLPHLIYSLRYSFLGVWLILAFQTPLESYALISPQKIQSLVPHHIESWLALCLYPSLTIGMCLGFYLLISRQTTKHHIIPMTKTFSIYFLLIYFGSLALWLFYYYLTQIQIG